MQRRDFLSASLAFGGLAGARPRPASAVAPARGFVTCGADRLDRVLVHTPGPEVCKILALGGGDQFLGPDLMEPHADVQHQRFLDLLRADGVEVLQFTDVLDEAIARARDAGEFVPWLRREAPQLVPHQRRVTAAALVGADDAFVYARDERGRAFRPLVMPLRFLFFTRDLAVMTPRGVVLAHFVNRTRDFETALAAFAFCWSPRLAGYPIAFDARQEGVYLQGGDVNVLDERTLLLGINNLTEASAAPLLARTLEMDVVAVELLGEGVPPDKRRIDGAWSGLRAHFLHLDSVINLLAPQVVLATPFFLEAEYAGQDPLTEILRGLAGRPDVHRRYLEQAIRALARIGQVQLYRAGSGEADPEVQGLKLVDFLRGCGYRVHYVGGPPPQEDAAKHLVECVHRELRFQAANVLATGPWRVIAPGGTERTEAVLRAAGIRVATFPADTLVRWYGGPRCMSLPLERTPEA